eukprot:CAMPEP_0171818550 /NCGR_PEP_ID=MMETSP0992-20121227/1717_1 /TAXON_ID=483369 /ORGANISM="non described non described, Strain CCMP2098" /LENGTH=56 /DNA_ID=CAMNT_0012432729 /DNA_START=1041 /DNA_END=1208 /DNA_ORIENTATION=+
MALPPRCSASFSWYKSSTFRFARVEYHRVITHAIPAMSRAVAEALNILRIGESAAA